MRIRLLTLLATWKFLLLLTMLAAPVQASVDDQMFWWVRNDGSPVFVPQDFYYEALYVVNCESRWNPYAVGQQGEIGWFQILPDSYAKRILDRLGYTQEELFDPGKNTEVAIEFWKERGWRPWMACRPD